MGSISEVRNLRGIWTGSGMLKSSVGLGFKANLFNPKMQISVSDTELRSTSALGLGTGVGQEYSKDNFTLGQQDKSGTQLKATLFSLLYSYSSWELHIMYS